MNARLRLIRNKTAAIILIAALVLSCAAEEKLAPHAWKRIRYPDVPAAKADEPPAILILSNDSKTGMRLSIIFSVPERTGKKATKPDIGAPTAVLHGPAGVLAKSAIDDCAAISMGGAVSYNFTAEFDWSKNELSEAWIELPLRGNRYWLEIPYGFGRNPNDPFPVEEIRGRPKFAPAMKDLGEKDWIVPVQDVEYEVGKIQNGWHMTLRVANPFDAEAVVKLYKEDGPWDLHKPVTTMRLGPVQGRCVGVRLFDELGRFRSDSFKFNRYPHDVRTFSAAEIQVGDKTYSVTVPSSLFCYTHGLADPYHNQLLKREK